MAPEAADVFLYSDRGVYRPGETVHLGALLRDTAGGALTDLPLTLRLVRPDEVEAHRYALADGGAGGYGIDIPISASARTRACAAATAASSALALAAVSILALASASAPSFCSAARLS